MNKIGSYFIPKFGLCDCGSPTYAHYHRKVNIFYKICEYIICGGCGQSFYPDELPLVFKGINKKLQELQIRFGKK